MYVRFIEMKTNKKSTENLPKSTKSTKFYYQSINICFL